MNRNTVMAIGLAVSILLNLALFVFAYVQKGSAQTAQELALLNEKKYLESRSLAKAELDTCEGLREQVEKAHEDCERKILALSNKK